MVHRMRLERYRLTLRCTRPLLGAALGGLAAGALDILYAFAQAGLNGRSPLRVLQAVASGLLGPVAFEGGIAAGLIGLACHFVITLAAAGIFLVGYEHCSIQRKNPVLAGVIFGALVYAFMHAVVLPLSAIPFKMTYSPWIIAQGLAVHIFLVGVPIALCIRRFALAGN